MEHSCPVGLVLPIPTSANRMWRTGRNGVYLSPEYTKWINLASVAVRAQGITRSDVDGMGPPPYAVEMVVHPGPKGTKGWRSNRDIDNCWKSPLDLLAKRLGILATDDGRTVGKVSIELGDPEPVAHVEVWISLYRRMGFRTGDRSGRGDPKTEADKLARILADGDRAGGRRVAPKGSRRGAGRGARGSARTGGDES